MPDQIGIRSGSARKRWPETGLMIPAHRLVSGPDPFGQTLTGVSQNQIRSALVSVYDSGYLWRSGTESQSKKKTGSGLVAFCQKPGPMIPAHRLASGRDVCGQNLTRPSRSDPGRFCTIRSRPSLEKWNRIGCGKSDSTHTILLSSGRNGHNWP